MISCNLFVTRTIGTQRLAKGKMEVKAYTCFAVVFLEICRKAV